LVMIMPVPVILEIPFRLVRHRFAPPSGRPFSALRSLDTAMDMPTF
jgi:hypothetical protein